MKKYFVALLIAFGLSLALNVVRAEDFVQRYTYEEVERQVVTSADLSFYSGDVTIIPSELMSAAGVGVDVRKLGILPEGGMGIPQEYSKIAGVYQIDLGLREVREPVLVKFRFSSDLKFPKFAMQFDEQKLNWQVVESSTDFNTQTVTFKLTKRISSVTVLDTDTMIYGHASWYRYKKCNCAASPDYPKGTQLLVTNLNKNQAIMVKVNDWGPERDIFPQRVIDLDLVAFEKLGTKGMGVLTNIMVLPFHEEDFDATEAQKLINGGVVDLSEEKLADLKPSISEKLASVSKIEISAPAIPTPIPTPTLTLTPTPQPIPTSAEATAGKPAPTTSSKWSGIGYYFLDN